MNRSAALALLVLAAPALAQVVRDGTLGSGPRTLTGPNYSILQSHGELRSPGNLFHSFRTFNLRSGEVATFSGAPGTQNVVARVTGNASSIDGTIRSSIAGANFYLINPKGIAFGPDARLDVGGSFHASTASYLRLGSTGIFDAVNPSASVLSAQPPSAFGFTGSPASITVDRSILLVDVGRTLSLVGGSIDIRGRGVASAIPTLWAPGGRLNLASAKSAGEVRFTSSGIDSTTADLGGIALADAIVMTETPGFAPGPVFIRGGRLSMAASVVSSRNERPGAGANVDIELSDELAMRGNSIIRSSAVRGGDAGNIRISAGSIRMTGGRTTIETSSADTATGTGGRAGSATIEARGDISLAEGAGITSISFFGALPAGDVRVRAGHLILSDGGNINVATFGDGNAGNVVIEVDRLTLRSGGRILAGSLFDSSLAPAAGDGGNVAVDAAGLVDISGAGSGIFSVTEAFGNGGTITLRARDLRIADGGRISSAAADPNGFGFSGNAGSIDATVTGSATLEGGGAITTESIFAGGGIITLRVNDVLSLTDSRITTSVADGNGNGGDINIDPVFVVLNNSQIIARAVGGNGGDITIVTQFILQDPASVIDASSQFGLSGQVVVTAPEIDVSSRLGALSSTFVDPASRLRESCAARASSGNSFVGVGRGGLPASPQAAAFAAYGSFAPLASLPPSTAAQCRS
jgi:filamentous hemagglutinin family protein